MNREQECYGKMFPSVVEMAHNKSCRWQSIWISTGLLRASGSKARHNRGPSCLGEVLGMP